MFAGLPFLWPFRAGPTPSPGRPVGPAGRREASYPQGQTLVVHAGLWITHACRTSVLFMRWITLPRLNIIDVVLSRSSFTSGLTLIVKLVNANLRACVVLENSGANRITHPTDQHNKINTYGNY